MSAKAKGHSPSENRLTEAVASEIRAWMARRRLSQVDVAARLGVSQRWVGDRLRGEITLTLDDLQAFARALDVSVSELLRDVVDLRRADYSPTTRGYAADDVVADLRDSSPLNWAA